MNRLIAAAMFIVGTAASAQFAAPISDLTLAPTTVVASPDRRPGQCHVLTTPLQAVAFPVIAVVPASTFATKGTIWLE